MPQSPTSGELTPEEVDRVRVVVTFLRQFVPAAWSFFMECQNSPQPGSFVARAKQDRDLVLVLDAGIWIDAAGDFLLDVAEEFQYGEIHRYAPYTTLRGALEWDARACWLLDPDVGDKVKVGRALTLRARSLFEMKRLRLPAGAAAHDQNYVDRMQRVTDAAQRWGPKARQLDTFLVAFVPTPGPTALIRCLLPEQSNRNGELTVGEQTYGELSARAHGTPWAAVGGTVPVARLNDFQSLARSELDVGEFLRLLGIVVSLHDKAIRRVTLAAGRDHAVWDQRRGQIPW